VIEGVAVKPIHVTADERGRVIEILRSDDPLFERFGQVFVSTAYPGVVKAWRRHKKQTSFLSVIAGMARVGLYDSRQDSPTYRETADLSAGPTRSARPRTGGTSPSTGRGRTGRPKPCVFSSPAGRDSSARTSSAC